MVPLSGEGAATRRVLDLLTVPLSEGGCGYT